MKKQKQKKNAARKKDSKYIKVIDKPRCQRCRHEIINNSCACSGYAGH